MPTGTPLPRPDLEDLTVLEIFTNSAGLIDGDKLQRVLLYIIASVPNLLTDGFLTGNPGAPVNVDYLALLRAIAKKADQSFVVQELQKKENAFTGLLTSELDPAQAAFAGLLLRPLLIKLVNALLSIGTPGGAADGFSITQLPNGTWQPSDLLAAYLDAGGEMYWMSLNSAGQRQQVSAGTSPAASPAANSQALISMAAGLSKP